jgi:hypothetical protein
MRFQKNDSKISNAINGSNTMVALSSIHLTLGNSPNTVSGARINEAKKGVPKKYELPNQIIYDTAKPPNIAALRPLLDRFISPMIGSTNVKPHIKGAA